MTSPERPTPARPVDRRGEPLDAERGPGLGCFGIQVGLLAILLVLTPLTVVWNWSSAVSAILLFLVMILLLFAGQTVIFLLRLVAAGRRDGTRHRPLASATPTVGELDDAMPRGTAEADATSSDTAAEQAEPAPDGTAATTSGTLAPARPRTTDPVVRE